MDSIFAPNIQHWVQTFYSLAVVQSALITGLMAFRIWQTDHEGAKYRVSEGRLMYVVRILVESAAFLLAFEVILLGMYIANYNAQYILLDAIATVVVSSLQSPRNTPAKEFIRLIWTHRVLHSPP